MFSEVGGTLTGLLEGMGWFGREVVACKPVLSGFCTSSGFWGPSITSVALLAGLTGDDRGFEATCESFVPGIAIGGDCMSKLWVMAVSGRGMLESGTASGDRCV